MELPEVSPYVKKHAKYTRRQWLTYQAILGGAYIFTALEAVASTAIEHPEWDMDEERTWEEWENNGA